MLGALGAFVLAVFGWSAAAQAATARPVPSLEPAKTAKQWKAVVAKRRTQALRASDCRPIRLVFYAGTDWLRLATKLAATPSPCAEYFVSVPAVVGDKTQLRADQAWRIRALGPNVHALAEIHYTAWANWVATTGNTWRAAGIEARRRMAAAGYDVNAGDSWALNELSSAVRRGDRLARVNVREFLGGLHDGDGTLPAERGVVFVTGMSQATTNLSVYQQNLQNWFLDAGFWTDMSRYVSDWSQELYGDARNVLVPGADIATRRDSAVDYLEHELTLARVAPAEAAAARSFLETAYSPLANAAWQYETAFGWTNVTVDLMQHYVSTQLYALRHVRSTSGPANAGFAWSPKNLSGAADFATQSATLLERLAAAIRDSAYDPAAACAGVWCGGDVEGGWLNTGWQSFRTWQAPPPPPADTTAPDTTITSAPTGTVATRTASIAFAATEDGSRFECSLDGGAYGACTSPAVWSALADGTHVARVRALDASGNVDATPAEAAWTVDATAPDTRITSAPPSRTTSRNATFWFAATETATFECSLNGSAWAACTSPRSWWSLPKGYWTFRVRALDAVGNVDATPAAYTWRIG